MRFFNAITTLYFRYLSVGANVLIFDYYMYIFGDVINLSFLKNVLCYAISQQFSKRLQSFQVKYLPQLGLILYL